MIQHTNKMICASRRERERETQREREREREALSLNTKTQRMSTLLYALCSALSMLCALCSVLCSDCPVLWVSQSVWLLSSGTSSVVLFFCSALLCSALLCSAALFFHLKCQNLMVWHFKWQGTGLLSSTIDKFSQAAIAFISSLAGDVASSNDFGCNCLADLKVR